MPGVTQEQIKQAREADLFAYLQSYEPGVLKRDGPNYRHKEHDSLVYVTSKRYWYWNSRGRSINALDYLIQIRGYGLVDAVQRLVGENVPQVFSYRSAGSPTKAQERKEQDHPATIIKTLLKHAKLQIDQAAKAFEHPPRQQIVGDAR